MSEEFKAVRITLSDEAFDRMDRIMKHAKFRNYSSTVEECIRAVDDIITEIHCIAGKRDSPEVTATLEESSNAFDRIMMRMSRFTGRILGPRTADK
jgi:hypothetical protein